MNNMVSLCVVNNEIQMLEKKIDSYREELERMDQLVEDINLSGLNSKQLKLIKKYFKERKNFTEKRSLYFKERSEFKHDNET